MRAAALIGSLVVIVALLAGAVWWAMPLLSTSPPSSSRKPQLVVIGLDISKSNPLVAEPVYAAKVAKRVAAAIDDFKLRDGVMIRTFGVYDPREQPLHLDRTVTPDSSAEDMAELVEGLIAGVPTLVERGTLKGQDSTNIVGFLENMAQVIDCKKRTVTIVLASDGIEQSDLVKMTQPNVVLPKPKAGLFKGCKSLQILGLGVGAKSPALTGRLREQWEGWAKQAGFKEFVGLNDW